MSRSLAPLVFTLALVLGTACTETRSSRGVQVHPQVARVADATVAARTARGERLFAQHCSACHGPDGAGRGPAAAFLFPPVRDLTHGRLRLVGSTSGVPLESDIVATLRRGMPGSAMPAWSWLGEPRLWDLAAFVRSLAVDRSVVATTLIVPAPRPLEWADLDRGSALYTQNCAACHGEDGTGTVDPRFDERGELDWARDFTAGLLKGGASRDELWRRIRLGMPGTSMGPTPLDDADTEALVAHVRTLIPAGNSERYVQERRELVARRVRGPLNEILGATNASAAAWELADEIRVVLAPLRSNPASVREAQLSALHDGTSIAIRVRWDDATTDLSVFTDTLATDAVALQFSDEVVPPLFGMGSAEHPVTIWHWRALRLSAAAGATDLVVAPPHVTRDSRVSDVRTDAPLYRRSEGVPPVPTAVERLQVQGLEHVASAARADAEARVIARATERGWEVVFVRSLNATASSDVVFTPGVALQVACAIWNRAAGDAGAQKSVGIWQELLLEP